MEAVVLKGTLIKGLTARAPPQKNISREIHVKDEREIITVPILQLTFKSREVFSRECQFVHTDSKCKDCHPLKTSLVSFDSYNRVLSYYMRSPPL